MMRGSRSWWMISTTFLFINALLMLCSVLAQDRSIRTADVSGVTFTLNASEICHDGSFIFFLQREQWNLARIELLGSLQSGFSGDDMEFYKRSFGIVEVALQDRQKNEPIQEQKPAAKGKAKPKPKANPKSTPKEGTASLSKSRSMLDSITYYRIFKNANDNIRSLLMQLAYELDNDSKGFHAQNCYKDECYHHRLSSKPAAAMKEHYVRATYSKRYPFTFVRDPIDRFISGMTEIEYRAQQVLKKSPNEFALPFQSPLGSQLRVNEFIRMILLSDASSILFRNQKLEIMHIVPMIGTFLLAQKVEGRPLKMFKLESFEQEWQSLANATKLTQLSNLYKSRSSKQWVVHPSSSDPYATTAAARNLFSFVSPQAFARFGDNIALRNRTVPSGYSLPQFKDLARKNLRAVCRMYLSDFICANYSLPSDCADLMDETKVLWRKHQHAKLEEQSFDDISDILRLILPSSWMQWYAAMSCIYAESPDCEARILLGAEHDEPERHDEL